MDDNLYRVLGVAEDVSQEEIDRAFAWRAAQRHPDRGGDPDQFKALSEAYEVLKDPARRATYDASRQTSQQGVHATSADDWVPPQRAVRRYVRDRKADPRSHAYVPLEEAVAGHFAIWYVAVGGLVCAMVSAWTSSVPSVWTGEPLANPLARFGYACAALALSTGVVAIVLRCRRLWLRGWKALPVIYAGTPLIDAMLCLFSGYATFAFTAGVVAAVAASRYHDPTKKALLGFPDRRREEWKEQRRAARRSKSLAVRP